MRPFRTLATVALAALAVPVFAATAHSAGIDTGPEGAAFARVAAAEAHSSAPGVGGLQPRDLTPHSLTISPANTAGATATYRLSFSTTSLTLSGDVIGLGFQDAVLPTDPSAYTFDGVPVTGTINQRDGDRSISVFLAPVTGSATAGVDDVITVSGIVNPPTPGSYGGAVYTEDEDATGFLYAIAPAAVPVVTTPVSVPVASPPSTPVPAAPVLAAGQATGQTVVPVPPQLKLDHGRVVYGAKVTAVVRYLQPGSLVTVSQVGGGHSYIKGRARANGAGIAKVVFTPTGNVTYGYTILAAGHDTSGAPARSGVHLAVLKKRH